MSKNFQGGVAKKGHGKNVTSESKSNVNHRQAKKKRAGQTFIFGGAKNEIQHIFGGNLYN